MIKAITTVTELYASNCGEDDVIQEGHNYNEEYDDIHINDSDMKL